MWDLEGGKAVAVVPGERQAEVQRMLERYASRESMRAVAMDLSEAYRQAVELVLPEAAIVADKFQVLALAGRALHEVHGETRRPGNLAWLLQRGAERLNQAQRAHVLEAAPEAHPPLAEHSADPRLARAWGLKEALREVYRKRSQEEAAAGLENWIREAAGSGLPPFRRSVATLRKWSNEVLNYWRFPITNALVEGKHNRIKVLKRRAYGYWNDRSFLLRILSLIHTD